ncbi:MAG: hypothetical protein ABI488_09120 [Polyangiaceae bacterium]
MRAVRAAELATVSAGDLYCLLGSDIAKVSTAGGNVSTVVPGASPSAIVVDSSGIYLAGLRHGTDQHAILEVSLDGSKIVSLASATQYVSDFAVYGTDVFWLDAEGFKSTPKTP